MRETGKSDKQCNDDMYHESRDPNAAVHEHNMYNEIYLIYFLPFLLINFRTFFNVGRASTTSCALVVDAPNI